MAQTLQDHAVTKGASPSSLYGRPGGNEILDPKGDLILAVGEYRFMVSSRVLELSCPFFEKLLRCNAFLEGVERPNADQPPIKHIDEDHPGIFYLICRVLHYLPVHSPSSFDDFGPLADLCNFYGCSWALSFHVRAWMEEWEFINLSSEQLQTLLWVAFVFHQRDQFQRISLSLAESLTPGKWKAWEVHPMPAQLKDDVRELCEKVKHTVQRYIEHAIDEVGADDERHIGKRDKFCCHCYRMKPCATKTCGNCKSTEFDDYVCNKEMRSSLFLEWLKAHGVWPLSRLHTQSCREFKSSLSTIILTLDERTPCGYDLSCPLVGSKKRLISNLTKVPSNLDGLNLDAYDPECVPEKAGDGASGLGC